MATLSAVRVLVAAVVVSSILAGCDGADGGGKAGSRSQAVVRSADGRAELTLPAGVAAKGISVEAIEAGGSAAAYELLPSGMTFDEPATLSIKGVPAPEGHKPAFAILRPDEGEADMVDGVATTYVDGDEGATVTLPIAHFSIVSLDFVIRDVRGVLSDDSEDVATLDTHVVDMGSPQETGVSVPFEVFVGIAQLDTRVDVAIPWAQDQSITVERVQAIGRVKASNATPAVASNLPRYGELGEAYRGSRIFRCTSPGIVGLDYTVEFRFHLAWKPTFAVVSTSLVRDASVSVKRRVRCNRAGSTTTPIAITLNTIIGANPVETAIQFTDGSCAPRRYTQQFRIALAEPVDGRVPVELKQLDTGQTTTGFLAADGQSAQTTGESSGHTEKYDIRRGSGSQIEGDYTATGVNGPCTWKIAAEVPAAR